MDKTASKPMPRRTYWLIEWLQQPAPYTHLHPEAEWLSRGVHDWTIESARIEKWTKDVREAIRFPSKEDAEAVIGWLWGRETSIHAATEHEDVDSSPRSPSEPQAMTNEVKVAVGKAARKIASTYGLSDTASAGVAHLISSELAALPEQQSEELALSIGAHLERICLGHTPTREELDDAVRRGLVAHEHVFCPHCKPCRLAPTIAECEDAMRELASYVAAGGYGSLRFEPTKLAQAIREGIDMLVRAHPAPVSKEPGEAYGWVYSFPTGMSHQFSLTRRYDMLGWIETPVYSAPLPEARGAEED